MADKFPNEIEYLKRDIIRHAENWALMETNNTYVDNDGNLCRVSPKDKTRHIELWKDEILDAAKSLIMRKYLKENKNEQG